MAETGSYEHFLSKVEKKAVTRRYRKNELIFNEGEILDQIYILNYGKVEVFKHTINWEERVIFILNDKSILNEEILFSENSKASTCCRAFEDSEILSVSKVSLLREIQEDVRVMQYVFLNSSIKLRRTYRQLKNSGTGLTIDKKILSKLFRLAMDFGIEKKGEIYIDVALTSVTLSRMVGAKRETVSRCINRLKKDGLITIESDKITITDFSLLSEMLNDNE
ncbi:MAG: Crp/Fnr family transcriptional regulator [Lachnospirales bacterium]